MVGNVGHIMWNVMLFEDLQIDHSLRRTACTKFSHKRGLKSCMESIATIVDIAHPDISFSKVLSAPKLESCMLETNSFLNQWEVQIHSSNTDTFKQKEVPRRTLKARFDGIYWGPWTSSLKLTSSWEKRRLRIKFFWEWGARHRGWSLNRIESR